MKNNICPVCKQNMIESPHVLLSSKYCNLCGENEEELKTEVTDF